MKGDQSLLVLKQAVVGASDGHRGRVPLDQVTWEGAAYQAE